MLHGIFLISLGLILGCATVPKNQSSNADIKKILSSDDESAAAMKIVAESLSGKELSDQDLKKISHDIKTDEQAQSAIATVTGAISSPLLIGHYCPVDGERFSRRVKICPKHHIPLKELEE